MNKKNIFITVIALAIVVIIGILSYWLIVNKAVFQNQNLNIQNNQLKNQPAPTEPIKIGYIGPLTGEAASIGEPGLAGAELAVKEINEAGGVLGRKLELVVEDDQCSNKGVDAMNKLVNVDKVIAITGPDCSASAGPSLPLAQNGGVPVIIRWASAPHLTKIGDYIFRIYPSDAFQGQFAADFIFNKLNKKKIAVLYVKNDWGQGLRDVFVEKFKSLGGEIVFDEGVTQEDKDFRSVISKIKAKKPEAIYLPLYMAGGVVAIKQIKESRLKIPVIGGDAFDADEVIKSDFAEGVMYTVAIVNNPEDFQKRVLEVTGKKSEKITAPMAYDSVKIIAEAIQKAGKIERQAIKEALKTISYKGISSPLIEFDENGDLKSAVFEVKVIKNKKAEKYQ
ncbi:MAG: ABC transporter substrate-binding protein [Patescibacteria group bacterium]|nr:ABC transporter substrate-binding protein [Patescibacteria group bacterium]